MANNAPPSDLTWLGSDRALARRLGRPVRRFLSIEAAGGILLITATIIALVWANSPWKASYDTFIHTEIEFGVGDWRLELDGHPLTIEEFVNDALMVVFFFVVGLEIKRELVTGRLRNARDAMLPAMGALGGMVVPAVVFFAINAGGVGEDGWGIPMATDIAFAIGVLSLLGDRVSSGLKVFLLSLAIVDDIGAILVIALFYSEGLSTPWLLISGATAIVILLLRQAKVWYIPLYVVVGMFFWFAVFESGVHATIAGVILGLITPAKPLADHDSAIGVAGPLVTSAEYSAHDLRRAAFHVRETLPVAERLEEVLHPFSSFLIIPVFALVNAGIELGGDSLGDAVASDVTLGVVAGLVIGKLFGITIFTWLAARLGLADLPAGATIRHIAGVAAIAGIGFTVSIFVTGLAFDDAVLQADAKIGILFASVAAAILGSLILLQAPRLPDDIDDRGLVAAHD